MEGSIEMKMQALNEMLDVREQMNDMLGKLEFYYLQAGESTNVLFRNSLQRKSQAENEEP